jgi:PAS domain S-box-containing protein
VAAFGIRGAVQEAPPETQRVAWATCVMLVVLAVTVLLLGRYVTRRSLHQIEIQLRTLTRNDELEPLAGPVPDELGSVTSALAEYVNLVRGRVESLRLQRKELDIQMRVADAERRHTEAIIFSISDAVLVIDSFGELVLANTSAERIFGFRLSEWRHRPIERVINDPSLLNLLREARTAGEQTTRRQVEYGTIRDGRAQTFNITLSTVVDTQGQSRGVVAVFHDITREREIAQIKTDFVSAVSHELRTPLSSIRAYIEMLMDGEARDEESRREFYGIIESETQRLQRLITRILDISRIESGVMEVNKISLQANRVIEQVLDVLRPQAGEKSIALEAELAPDLPGVWADRDLFYQAVLNVAGNAVKYTPDNGRVFIRTNADLASGHLVVTVQDTGAGIDPRDLPRIFDKFFRSDNTRTLAKGTGLGLNLVKHIVETVHRGEIVVTSEYGAGTTMVLRFPLLVK